MVTSLDSLDFRSTKASNYVVTDVHAVLVFLAYRSFVCTRLVIIYDYILGENEVDYQGSMSE